MPHQSVVRSLELSSTEKLVVKLKKGVDGLKSYRFSLKKDGTKLPLFSCSELEFVYFMDKIDNMGENEVFIITNSSRKWHVGELENTGVYSLERYNYEKRGFMWFKCQSKCSLKLDFPTFKSLTNLRELFRV